MGGSVDRAGAIPTSGTFGFGCLKTLLFGIIENGAFGADASASIYPQAEGLLVGKSLKSLKGRL